MREPSKTLVEVVRLQGFTLGRLSFEPGWRWSSCIKPVAKTDSCHLSHVGYAVSGRLTVKTDDGKEMTISQGDSYTIPPVMTPGSTAARSFSASRCSPPTSSRVRPDSGDRHAALVAERRGCGVDRRPKSKLRDDGRIPRGAPPAGWRPAAGIGPGPILPMPRS